MRAAGSTFRQLQCRWRRASRDHSGREAVTSALGLPGRLTGGGLGGRGSYSGVETQTWISLGAAVVAVGSAALNFWNVNRSLRHSTEQADRRSYTEAADTLTGLLVRGRTHLDRPSALDARRPHAHSIKRSDAWHESLVRELESSRATALELSTAEIIFRSRCEEGDILKRKSKRLPLPSGMR